MGKVWLAGCLLVLVGCSRPDPFVGTWTANSQVLGVPSQVTMTLAANGSYLCVTRAITASGRGLIATDSGTWKRTADDDLEVTLADVTWEPVGAAKNNTAFQAKFEAQKPQLLADSNKDPLTKVVWNGNDEFTATDKAGSVVFVRKPPE